MRSSGWFYLPFWIFTVLLNFQLYLGKLFGFYPTLQLNLPLSLSPKTPNSMTFSIPHLNYSRGHNQKSWLLLLLKSLILTSEGLQLQLYSSPWLLSQSFLLACLPKIDIWMSQGSILCPIPSMFSAHAISSIPMVPNNIYFLMTLNLYHQSWPLSWAPESYIKDRILPA